MHVYNPHVCLLSAIFLITCKFAYHPEDSLSASLFFCKLACHPYATFIIRTFAYYQLSFLLPASLLIIRKIAYPQACLSINLLNIGILVYYIIYKFVYYPCTKLTYNLQACLLTTYKLTCLQSASLLIIYKLVYFLGMFIICELAYYLQACLLPGSYI